MRKGWEIKKLSELGDLQTGTTPPTSKKENFGDFIPFIKPSDFYEDGMLEYNNEGLSELGIKNSRLIKKGSILMVCIGATIGKTGYAIEDICCNQQINTLTPKNKAAVSKYLYYGMITDNFQKSVKLNAAQATLPIINKSKWSNLGIPIPSLSEQQRIVAILDNAFEAIDQAKANTEKNLQNAKELFQSELNSIFTNKGEGWVEKKFDQILKVNQIGLIRSSRDQGASREFRYLKMDAITIDNSLLEKKCVFVDASSDEVEKYKLDEGDFLFNTRNSFELVGKTCVYFPESDEPTLFNNNIMRVKFIDGVNSKFINYAFSSKGLRDSLEKMKSGTTSVVGIYFNTLKSLMVPVPNIEIQKHIIHQLDTLSVETKQLEYKYRKKLERLEELKKSILQKAFSGELTKVKEMSL